MTRPAFTLAFSFTRALDRTPEVARRFYAALRPMTKCKISEITAKTSKRWIIPPATWNTVNPPSHAISRTTNSIVQMLISSPPRRMNPIKCKSRLNRFPRRVLTDLLVAVEKCFCTIGASACSTKIASDTTLTALRDFETLYKPTFPFLRQLKEAEYRSCPHTVFD